MNTRPKRVKQCVSCERPANAAKGRCWGCYQKERRDSPTRRRARVTSAPAEMTYPITFYVTGELKRRIEEQADKSGRSVSWLVRSAVSASLRGGGR